LEPPERPEGTVGLSGEPLEYWERSRWLPSLASSIAGSVVGIHRRLPDLQYYGLDTGAVVDFVTSQSHQSVRRVHQTEEQLWLEFVDQIAQTRFDAVREYPVLERNDSARTAIHLARLVRDTLAVLDIPTAAIEGVPPAGFDRMATANDQTMQQLVDTRQTVVSLLQMEEGTLTPETAFMQVRDSLNRLTGHLDAVWSGPLGRMDGTAVDLVVGPTGELPTLWDVELGAVAQYQEQLAEGISRAIPVVASIAGIPHGLALMANAVGVLESRAEIQPVQLQTPVTDLLRGEVDPVWAGRLLQQFGREHVYRIRSILIRLRDLVVSLLRLSVLGVRKVSVDWDALVTEVLFESRLGQWRRSLVTYFVRNIVSVLDQLLEVLQFAEYLRVDEVGEWMAPLVEEVHRMAGRVAQVVREHFYEQTTRKRVILVRFQADHERVQRLARLKVILDRWIGVLDEVLALPVVSATLSGRR